MMRCPICGLMGSDHFHIAGHTLSYERHHGRGMPDAPGGPPVYFLTFREAAMISGTAIERATIRFENRRAIVEERA